MKRERGWSLLEQIAVCALTGILILTVGALVPRVSEEARGLGRDEARAQERWLAVRMLRADVHRAVQAQVEGDALRLRMPRGETVVWTPGARGITRSAGAAREFRVDGGAAPFRIDPLPDGRLVAYRVGTGRLALAGQALVGRDRWRRP